MANTVGTPGYIGQVTKMDTSTPAYGPTFDAVHQQLLNNDAFLSQELFSTLQAGVPSGVLDYFPTVRNGLNYNSGIKGEIQITGADATGRINNQSVIINGYKILVDNGGVTGSPFVSWGLSSPPSFGTRDDLAFLEAWFDGTSGALNWRIRTVAGVNFTKYPEGLYDRNVQTDYSDAVLAQGANASPVTTAGSYAVNAFCKNWAGVNKDAFLNDKGLFVAGDGTSASKTALGTLDGYVYAIPLFRVKRRNNGGYRNDNVNGAKDYANAATSTMTGTLNYVGSSYTIPVGSTTGFNVGDTVYFAGSSSFQGIITSVNSSTSLTYTCTANPNSYTLSTGQGVTKMSDRPDGLYSNIIDAEDIMDLRHQVSLTGFDKSFLLKSSFDKLMRGELRSNVKYTTQKEKWNLKKAPFGISQQLQPVNVVGNDGVTRSLTNLLGTKGNCESLTGWTGQNGATLSLDSTNKNYGNYGIKSTANGASVGMWTNISGILQPNSYYLVAVDILACSVTGGMYIQMNNIYTNTGSGVSSGTLFLKVPTGATVADNILYVYSSGASANQTVTMDGIRIYQIDQTTYNNIGTAGFATSSDIASKFPYVDSYPNFVENVFDITKPIAWWNSDTMTSLSSMRIYSQRQNVIGTTFALSLNPNTQYTLTYQFQIGGNATENYSKLFQTTAGTNYIQWGLVGSGLQTCTYTFTSPSDGLVSIEFARIGGANDTNGWLDIFNVQLEKVNTGMNYPNPFVPYGRWIPQLDAYNAQLGGTQTILHNQNTTGGTFNGLRSNFSDAQISQTVVDVVESNGYTGQRHITTTQQTTGQWKANDTVKITSYYGVVDGVVSGGEVSRIISQDVTNTIFTVDTLNGVAVNDYIEFLDSNMNVVANKQVTATSTSNGNTITVSGAVSGASYIVEVTASKASPTVTDNAGNTIAGTWAGLGTKTATFTITTPPATNTSNLTITYSVSYPTGQGFSYLPLQSSDVLQASVNGDVLHASNTASVKANFLNKVSGNTDANPHITKWARYTSLLAPSDATYAEVSGGVYSSINSLDSNTWLHSSSTSGQQAMALFQFDVIRAIEDKFGEIPADGRANKATWIKNNMSNIQLDWYGYGSSVNGNKSYLACWGGSSWLYPQNSTASAPTKLTFNVNNGTQSTYVDSNGYAYFLAYTDPAGAVANPTVAPTLSASGSGSGLSAGTYYVQYVWANSNGQTLLSPEASITITSGQNIVVTVPSLPFGVTGVNVYMSTTSGSEQLQGTTGTTTYNQTSAINASGGSAGGSNTCVVNSAIYTDYAEFRVDLNTAESGFTVLQSDNPFPTMNPNILYRNMALPIDISGFATSGDGMLNAGSTISIDTAQPYMGNGSSLKVVTTSASSQQGIVTNGVSAISNTYYTASVWFKGTSGNSYKLGTHDSDNAIYSTPTTFTATGQWQLITNTIKTGTGYVSTFRIGIFTASATADTFWIGCLKLEQGVNPNPQWTPGRNKNFLLNYLGKVAGSTAENPNSTRGQDSSTFASPSTIMGNPERTQTYYNNIGQLDGTIQNITSGTTGNYAQQLFEFDLSHLGMSLTELKNALRQINVNWTGYGSGDNAGTLTNGATVAIWDVAGSSWNGNWTNTSSSPSLVTNTVNQSSSVNKITNNQKVYILAYSTYPASATNPSIIYTDYISLQVTLGDYVDYVKSNIVKVRPSTMEIKTFFPAKSNRYTGASGMVQEDMVDLWYRHVPVYPSVSDGTLVTVLSESDGWLASDLGSNMGAVQGTHPYQNPLYRVGNDQMNTFGQYGFSKLSWAEDSRDVNTGAQVQVSHNGFSQYYTQQNALGFVKKPLVTIARWLVLNQNGELQLLVLSAYSNNGTAVTNNNNGSGTVILLVPIQGRPLVKDLQGVQRSLMNTVTAWKTKESSILV